MALTSWPVHDIEVGERRMAAFYRASCSSTIICAFCWQAPGEESKQDWAKVWVKRQFSHHTLKTLALLGFFFFVHFLQQSCNKYPRTSLLQTCRCRSSPSISFNLIEFFLCIYLYIFFASPLTPQLHIDAITWSYFRLIVDSTLLSSLGYVHLNFALSLCRETK